MENQSKASWNRRVFCQRFHIHPTARSSPQSESHCARGECLNPAEIQQKERFCAHCEILQPKELIDCRGPWARDTLVQVWLGFLWQGCWLVLRSCARAAVHVWEPMGPRYPEPRLLVHRDPRCHLCTGCSLAEGGAGPRWEQANCRAGTASWAWQQYCLKCGISLEIRIKTVLIISSLESKAPSKAH